MPIHHHKGGTTLTGDSVSFFRLAAMRSAVGLELKGLRVRRGPVVWKQAAREFGIKGNKQAVYDELTRMVEEQRVQQEHVDEHGRRTVAGEPVQ